MRHRCSFQLCLMMLAVSAVLCSGAPADASGPPSLSRDVPHYFHGGNECFVRNTQMGLSVEPKAWVWIEYEGQVLKDDWEFVGCAPFGGVTTGSVSTKGTIKLVVKLWDGWGGFQGKHIREFGLDPGDNRVHIQQGNVSFRINFKYPTNWTNANPVRVQVVYY